MTKKLYWENPYQTNLNTIISASSGQIVQVEETIFFAFSGGQESDAGTIGGYSVIEAKKVERAINYTIEENHGLQIGDRVEIRIDWDRRYCLMRLHFATELVLELINQKFPGIQKIGAHIAADKARIDFLWEESLGIHLPGLQEQIQRMIDQNLPIISAFSDETQEKRFWEIPGFAKIACGGTHIKSTGEIKKIHLKRKNPGKGKERIEIFLDEE